MLTEIILSSIITIPLIFVLVENNINKQSRPIDNPADITKIEDIQTIKFFGESKMTKFNENVSVEETEAYKMGELLEASRELQEAEASRPIHEIFGCTVEEWNASCDAFDRAHDAHGTRGFAGRAWQIGGQQAILE